MVIVCPSCGSRYSVDNSLLQTRLPKVRCISCKHVWVYSLSNDDVISLTETVPESSNMLGWSVFTGFVFSVLVALFFAKEKFCHIYPYAYSFYQKIGLLPDVSSIKIKNHEVDHKYSVLNITLENIANVPVAAPNLLVNMDGEDKLHDNNGYTVPALGTVVISIPIKSRISVVSLRFTC